ncbi:uncharacterized protein LOC122024599 [Zingiber officinale]|uniref:Vacuolar protein sorting-associated protein 62 n=1 Tax=Zingiber officinale TaxID=94328 RepID=A0A8J5F0N2_ZINOF|nr:uncharacterized protein LOC122024599 [Zingiber officinale]KAG6476547.1 hypothetical protein ZIOFF_065789 [Zingiber officinale]
MERWKWFCWSRGMAPRANSFEPEPYSLPCPMPDWPQGGEFAKGTICIGELEVVQITRFERIWGCLSSKEKGNGAIFYKPSSIPEGFFSLGHFCHRCDQPLHGFVLVVRENAATKHSTGLPALVEPVDYAIIWSSNDFSDDYDRGCSYFWLPIPPEGYRALGIFVTSGPDKPSIEEVRCVRVDLTDSSEAHELMIDLEAIFPHLPCQVWKMRPSSRGLWGTGVSVGTFCCNTDLSSRDKLSVHCLKNLDSSLNGMPNLEQIHALIQHYGPTLMFHPKEVYLPSSVSWFFENGATLHKKGAKAGEIIDVKGSNLPLGGQNDGEYWIDLPDDDDNKDSFIKKGNIETAELYVHVKPAMGGTFTDISMWIFCPFNGPATIKVGAANFSLSKVGQHVGDWEHYTLRISNFNGELWSIYFSQHSGGEWVDAPGLEFIGGNKAVVYSSKSGHASFPHQGNYLQGSEKLGIGIRNDAARSKFFVDSSTRYQIVAAEYLGDVEEPFWLQYMRGWGPSIKYNSRSEIDRILSFLPFSIRNAVKNIFNSLPMELYGEEGPTGPKEKNNWVGDERW